MCKRTICFALVLLLGFDGRAFSQNSAPSSAARAAAHEPGDWTNTTFVELVKRAKADCTVDTPNVIRCSGPVRIDSLAKTSINGKGVRVEFSDARPGRGGIVLANATDVVLADIEIGWLGGGARDPVRPDAPRIQTFGDVTGCANDAPGGALLLELPLQGTQPVGAVTVWDKVIGWPWYRAAPDAVEVYFPGGTQASFSKGRSECFPQLAPLVGRHVLVRHLVYANHAFQCWGCRNVTIEKVKVTSAPGMAFLFSNGGSKLVLRNDVSDLHVCPIASVQNLPLPRTRRISPASKAI